MWNVKYKLRKNSTTFLRICHFCSWSLLHLTAWELFLRKSKIFFLVVFICKYKLAKMDLYKLWLVCSIGIYSYGRYEWVVGTGNPKPVWINNVVANMKVTTYISKRIKILYSVMIVLSHVCKRFEIKLYKNVQHIILYA